MDLKHLVVLAFQISLFVIVFGYGLQAEFADLLYLYRRPALLLRSLIAVLVVMPAVAVALARWFDFTPTVEIALVALAISPLPPLLPTREAKAGGGERYGLGLMVVLAVLSIALVPLAVQLIGSVFGRTYVTTPATIALVMSTSILLPLLVGMLTRVVAPTLADKVATQVARAGKSADARRSGPADRSRGIRRVAARRQRHHHRHHRLRCDGVRCRTPAGRTGTRDMLRYWHFRPLAGTRARHWRSRRRTIPTRISGRRY